MIVRLRQGGARLQELLLVKLLVCLCLTLGTCTWLYVMEVRLAHPDADT